MNKHTILIVEDVTSFAKGLQRELEKQDYTTIHVRSGEEALKIVHNKAINAIIMDIDLEGKKSGIETANDIYKDYDIPIVYLSSHKDPLIYNQAKRGVYLSKPVNYPDLIINLERIIKQQEEEQTPLPTDKFIFTRKYFYINAQNDGMGNVEKINIEDIYWIHTSTSNKRHYFLIVTKDKVWQILRRNQSLDSKFTHPSLLRIHRSYLVNGHKIANINVKSWHIELEDIEEIEDRVHKKWKFLFASPLVVSPKFRSSFKEAFALT